MYGYNNAVPNPLVTTISSTTTSLSPQTSSASSISSGTSSLAVNNVQATSTSSQSSNSASPAPTAASWSYIGCWTDAVGSRSLGYQITGNANIMTNELCMSECASAGYSLAGLEYYSECYCDTQVRNGGPLATDPTTCNTACSVSRSNF